MDRAPQLLYTELAIVLGLTQLFLPLAIISCYSAVAQVDPGLDDAARGLGASRTRTFWGIVAPLSAPGIVVAATLVFAGSATPMVEPCSKPDAASPEPASVRAELEQPLRISVVGLAAPNG